MAKYDLKELLAGNVYPGRGIVIGMSADGKNALIAYFIMGRSVNSRNRVFEEFDGGMRTKAFDESKVVDPSLIIYNPYLRFESEFFDADIITNGNQTDTVYEFLKRRPRKTAFTKALATREFEPDAPNFTPRISGIVYYKEGGFRYSLSILKSDGTPDICNRFFFDYEPKPGVGHFIHTYKCDGNPIPSFEGEPEEVALPSDAAEFAKLVWDNLNADNKVSLFVRNVPLSGGNAENIIINKNV
ncbi:MAG: IMP cyclohydrolase [Clostridia bacterium]|nr:IMP cyclohydrolase [Clostridia bacterium]